MGIEKIKIIIYLSGSAIIFLIGNHVFLKDPKRNLNKIFFIFSLAGALWGISAGFLQLIFPNYPAQREEIIKEIPSAIKVFLMEDIGILSAYSLSSLFLNLCLTITEKKEILKRKLTYLLIYLPPFIIFIYAIIFDFYFTLRKIEFPGKLASALDILSFFYFELFLLIGLFLLFKRYFSLKSFQERKKLVFFLIGAIIPAFFGSISSVILPVFFKIKGLGWITYSLYALGYIFIGIGILGHALFIDYREILENIFKRLNELVIITDKEGIILLTNEITPKKLGYEKKEIIGKKMEEILKGGKEKWREILNRSKEFGPILEEKAIFLTKKKEENPFLLNFSQTKEGLIFVGRDIKEIIEYQEKLEKEAKERTEELEEAKNVLEIKVKARTKELSELAQSLEEKVKEKTKELQEKLEELERFQKFAVGRELKMVELKKEVEELKEELSRKKGRKIKIQKYGEK
jgi:PAS domain S-box-containing protein